ncbi:hypothetical protein [Flavobacterium sp. MK4S-17]|jgi:hypothetical protein|uniref:hypothetical protein n=1 Tax=Flavobacterium sp. MK4S-17 TaxID=2543737 RepID=UPI001356C279|nr:hypothetical protein [Flavobacterium sp. MK4S-17]
MKLKELKSWINRLPQEELEKDLLFNAIDYGVSGTISEINKTDENLYYIGEDPAVLHTEAELKKLGYSQDDIAELDIEIPQGCYYVELNNEYSILERFL